MEKILKQSKEKVEEFVFGKDGENRLYKKEYKKQNDDMKYISLCLGPIFFISLIIGCMIQTFDLEIAGFIKMITVFAGIICFFSGWPFLVFFLTFISGLFSLEKTYTINKNEIKTKKLKETPLSLKVLNEMTPLIGKIKEKLSEEEFIELMEVAEIETGEKLGNAYYFLYLIENYDDLLDKVRERKEDGKNLQKKLSALSNFNKENPL